MQTLPRHTLRIPGVSSGAHLSQKVVAAATTDGLAQIWRRPECGPHYLRALVQGAAAYAYCISAVAASQTPPVCEPDEMIPAFRACAGSKIRRTAAYAQQLRPVMNPSLRPVTAYYPAMGFDLPGVLATTEASVIIGADKTRKFYDGTVDIYAALRFIITSMVGEAHLVNVDLPPGNDPGRAEFAFRSLNPRGEYVDRRLLYYTGVDAAQFVPPETKDGYQICYGICGAWFYLWPSTRPLVDALLTGGQVLFEGANINPNLLRDAGHCVSDAIVPIRTFFGCAQHRETAGIGDTLQWWEEHAGDGYVVTVATKA